jgi:ribonuclease R
LNEQDVTAHLGAVTRAASLREMAHALGLRHAGRRTLKKIIAKLLRRHEIEEVQNGRYMLAGKKGLGARDQGSGKDKKKEEWKGDRGTELQREKATTRKESGGKENHAGPKAGATGARDPNVITGRIVTHRDGYGFVLPDEPVPGMEGDLFIGRDALGDAMHGDRVQARIERRGTRMDRGQRVGRAEGRVVRILKRAHETLVGEFHYDLRPFGRERGNYVIPFDARLKQEIVIPPGEELTAELKEKLGSSSSQGTGAKSARLPELDGAVVNVEITRFPGGGIGAAGRVMEILGRVGDIGVDTEIIIRKHHLPHEFPEEVLGEAAGVSQEVSADAAGSQGREDFRSLPIVTIDGETAKDFDDAVHVEKLPNGHYELQVHIADVAHYVKRASDLDREARVRGTSVYFPNRAVPMLPEALSNGICSLNPKVDRLVMSAVMEMDAHGKMVRARFTPGVIRSVERMTYTNVNKVLEGDPEVSGRYAALAERFRLMKELALILSAKREKRGSIDFDLPERVIEFDELNRMKSIVRSERNIANRIIEEFMLAANEAVANYLEKRGITSLHRVHEKPDAKKVMEFEELAKAFGYTLGVEDLAEKKVPVKHGQVRAPSRHGKTGAGRMRAMTVTLPSGTELNIRPQHYQALVRKIEGKPEERILSYLMLRSLKQARYDAAPLGHFALACDEYTHFTSPIRRYPDLIVHRLLKWALEHPHAKAADEFYRQAELEEMAAESSDAERRADLAERELMDWKTAQFMEQHLGDEYSGLIISVHKFGFFVELLELFVEGLVPIAAIEEFTGGGCFYRESDRAILIERGGRHASAARGGGKRPAPPHRTSAAGAKMKAFRLGDRVRIRAERIDPFQKRVEFALL